VGLRLAFNGPEGEEIVHVCGGNMESNSVDTLRLAAVNGQGLLMVPSFLVTEDIKSGRLVPVLQEYCRTERQIMAIYPIDITFRPRCAAFLTSRLNTSGVPKRNSRTATGHLNQHQFDLALRRRRHARAVQLAALLIIQF